MAIRIAKTAENRRKIELSAYVVMDDNHLLALFHDGDARAFQALMSRHRGIIWRVVRQYLGSLDDVDDIFQDISLIFYQNRDVYQADTAKFSSWLYRVTVNKCLDILRARKGNSPATQLDEATPSSGPTAEDIVESHQLSALVQNLLATLPQQQRLALSLYYIHDQDVPSISARLEVSEDATRALIKRGKNNLRGKTELLVSASDYR